MKYSKNKFAIKRYGKLMRFANWLQQIPDKVTPPPFRLIQIGSAFWQSRALYVGAKIGLADAIGDSEKSTATLARTLSLNEDHLYRLIRMLSSMGVFIETSHRTFKNSKLSEYLRKDNPDNVLAMVVMHNSPEMTKPWFEALETSIQDGGIPFEKIHGMDLFEYMNQHRDFDALFSAAMDSVENIAGTAFLDDFNWGEFRRIIDVGGSKGSKSLSILKANPQLKAVVFDRPQVIEGARDNWRGKENDSLLDRMEFVGGDILKSIPPAESDDDVYLFMAVFHTFNDSDCKIILHNLKTAIGNKSSCVVIADTVPDEVNIDSMTASMDMQMLMGTKGRERTLSEWENLVNGTGFNIESVMDIRTFAKYIVLRLQ
jgi:SAM-dependent methyltransferase